MQVESLDTQSELQGQTAVRPSQPALRMTLPGPTLPLDSHPDNVRKFVATHMKSPKTPTPAPERSEPETKPPAQTASTAAPPEAARVAAPLQEALSEEMQKTLQEMGWIKPVATPQQSGSPDASNAAVPKSADQGFNGGAVATGADKALNGVATTNGEDKGLDTTSGSPVGTSQGLNGPPVAKPIGSTNDSKGQPVPQTTAPADQRVSPPGTTTAEVTSLAGHPGHQPARSATGHGMPGQPLQNIKEEPKLDQRQAYSRRAAANLISRLRDNPKRVEGYPALKKMVFSDEKKSDLITMLCDSNGELEAVGASLQAFEETCVGDYHRKKALRWTKKEMEDHYGTDAEAVMKHKIQQGLVEDDENLPGGQLFLVARKEDEHESGTRSGTSFQNMLFPCLP